MLLVDKFISAFYKPILQLVIMECSLQWEVYKLQSALYKILVGKPVVTADNVIVCLIAKKPYGFHMYG